MQAGSATAAPPAAASAGPVDLPNKRPRIDLPHQGTSVATPLTIDTREAVKVGITFAQTYIMMGPIS